MTDLLRVYFDPAEIHATTGYPYAWSQESESADQSNRQLGDGPRLNLPIKNMIRERDGNRCLRCGHPYRKGEHGNGEWSACDEKCVHTGPVRSFAPDGIPSTVHQGMNWGSLIAEGYLFDAQWRILTVHHLNGVKHDCRWWNLVSLCQVCHLKVQGRVRMEQVYPHPHSTWFKPYAAAYYAWAYLDQELTREEVTERMDELLALELDPSYRDA